MDEIFLLFDVGIKKAFEAGPGYTYPSIYYFTIY